MKETNNKDSINNGEKMEKPVVRNQKGQFVQGSVPNPKGRPKGSKNKTISAKLKEFLKEIDENTGSSYEDMMLKALAYKAITKKDVRAMELIFNRTDGKVPQPIEFQDKTELEKNLKVVELMEGFERMGNKWFVEKEGEKDES